MFGHHADTQQILNQIGNELRADSEVASPPIARGGAARQPVSPSRHERRAAPFIRDGAARQTVSPGRLSSSPMLFTLHELVELRRSVQAARNSKTMWQLALTEFRTFTDRQFQYIYQVGIMTMAEVVCVRNHANNAWESLDDATVADWLDGLTEHDRAALFRQGLLSLVRMPQIQLHRYLRMM